MRIFDPNQMPTRDVYQLLIGMVGPRPIALASTVDAQGKPNLAPYSFFNAFSSDPPMVVFSSNRRGADNTTKDTLHNIQATGEVVINAVNYKILRQMALTSVEYPTEVNEFEKSGLTPLASDLVKPFRVKESPANMECKVEQILPLGEKGGAGHLIICRIVRFHVAEEVFDANGRIDPHKMDLMGRLGRAYYVRAGGKAVHAVVQPLENTRLLGFDGLPEQLRNSKILTGNELSLLANLPEPPDAEAVQAALQSQAVQAALQHRQPRAALHRLVRQALKSGQLDQAAAIGWVNVR